MKFLPVLLLSILFVLPGESVNAQVLKRIGYRVGYSLNYPDVVDEIDGEPRRLEIKNRPYGYLDLQAEWFQHKHLSLLTSVSYLMKGFRYKDKPTIRLGPSFFSGGNNSSFRIAKANYFTLTAALNLQYNLRGFTFYGFTGPYVSTLNRKDNYYYFDSKNSSATSTLPEKGDLILSPWIFGGTIGGGISHKLDDEGYYISAQAQFMQDFTKAGDYSTTYTDNNGEHNFRFKARNKTLLLSLGIHYMFNKK